MGNHQGWKRPDRSFSPTIHISPIVLIKPCHSTKCVSAFWKSSSEGIYKWDKPLSKWILLKYTWCFKHEINGNIHSRFLNTLFPLLFVWMVENIALANDSFRKSSINFWLSWDSSLFVCILLTYFIVLK